MLVSVVLGCEGTGLSSTVGIEAFKVFHMLLKIPVQLIDFSLRPLLTKVIHNALDVLAILELYNSILADGIHADDIVNLIEFHILFNDFFQSFKVFFVLRLDVFSCLFILFFL